MDKNGGDFSHDLFKDMGVENSSSASAATPSWDNIPAWDIFEEPTEDQFDLTETMKEYEALIRDHTVYQTQTGSNTNQGMSTTLAPNNGCSDDIMPQQPMNVPRTGQSPSMSTGHKSIPTLSGSSSQFSGQSISSSIGPNLSQGSMFNIPHGYHGLSLGYGASPGMLLKGSGSDVREVILMSPSTSNARAQQGSSSSGKTPTANS